MRRVLMDNRRHGWQEAIANDLRGETGVALSTLDEGMEKRRLTRRFELLNKIGEKPVRYRRVALRQEHIDEGVRSSCRECPIALALYEELFFEDAPPPIVSIGKSAQAHVWNTGHSIYEITYPLMDMIIAYDRRTVPLVPMELMILETEAGRPRPECSGWLT